MNWKQIKVKIETDLDVDLSSDSRKRELAEARSVYYKICYDEFNMSLSAIDSIMFGIPAFTHMDNIASPISNTDISKINEPMKPNKEIINEWINCVSQNQFTLDEIGSGIAYEILKRQNEDTIL